MASEKKEKRQDMSLEEAKAYRASLYKEESAKLSEQDKREQFRIYWTENRNKFGKGKDLEEILWVHLIATGLDDPKNFDKGLAHFGLKEI